MEEFDRPTGFEPIAAEFEASALLQGAIEAECTELLARHAQDYGEASHETWAFKIELIQSQAGDLKGIS